MVCAEKTYVRTTKRHVSCLITSHCWLTKLRANSGGNIHPFQIFCVSNLGHKARPFEKTPEAARTLEWRRSEDNMNHIQKKTLSREKSLLKDRSSRITHNHSFWLRAQTKERKKSLCHEKKKLEKTVYRSLSASVWIWLSNCSSRSVANKKKRNFCVFSLMKTKSFNSDSIIAWLTRKNDRFCVFIHRLSCFRHSMVHWKEKVLQICW